MNAGRFEVSEVSLIDGMMASELLELEWRARNARGEGKGEAIPDVHEPPSSRPCPPNDELPVPKIIQLRDGWHPDGESDERRSHAASGEATAARVARPEGCPAALQPPHQSP